MPWNLLLPGAGISCPAALSAVANSGEYDCISDRSKNVSKLVVTTAGFSTFVCGSQAYYSPVTDHIQMPPFETFRDAASYVATLSHESCHWTARPDRVGRDLSRYAKDKSERAREELIAELGSCFLCADLGIAPELEPRPDHASYLASWLKVISDDKRAIFQAAAHAQRAVNFLHGIQPIQADERAAA
jgi:antirestriction protein ArdC